MPVSYVQLPIEAEANAILLFELQISALQSDGSFAAIDLGDYENFSFSIYPFTSIASVVTVTDAADEDSEGCFVTDALGGAIQIQIDEDNMDLDLTAGLEYTPYKWALRADYLTISQSQQLASGILKLRAKL